MKLLVISHTPHYETPDGIKGWGSTVREIDWLSGLFTSTTHLAILHKGITAPESSLEYQSPSIKLRLLPPSGGPGIRDKVGILKRYPLYRKAIREELQTADIVHIRCPANISLLGLLIVMLRSTPRYRWIKYAGNWAQSAKRPWSYTIQRWMLEHNYHRGIVTVNGCWEVQKEHIWSFHNPSFSDAESRKASMANQHKLISQPLRLLFVGRLEEAKGVGFIIRLASRLKAAGIQFELDLAGDGPERSRYEEQVNAAGLKEAVHFVGWIPNPNLFIYFKKAHLLLLPSETEGWPKVLSEGMAHGVVPLANAVGSIPQYLEKYGCGWAMPPGDMEAYIIKIQSYLEDQESWKKESKAGMTAAEYFTFENYLKQVQTMADKAWGLYLPGKNLQADH